MNWGLAYQALAAKALRKLERSHQQQIEKALANWLGFLNGVAGSTPPDIRPMKGTKTPLWRLRSGDFRVVCQVQNEQLIVLVVRVGHRRDVYDDHS